MSMHQDDYKNEAVGAWGKVTTFIGEHKPLAIGVGCFIAGIVFAFWMWGG